MYNFTIWFIFQQDWHKYTILRNLDKYFDEQDKFEFDQFYSENYILFEKNINLKNKNDLIIKFQKNIKIHGYINFEDVKDFHNINKLLKTKLSSDLLSDIFFIEWWIYNIYDELWTLIDKIRFSKKIWKFWITKKKLKKIGDIEFILYPSKAVNDNFINDIINKVNDIFPWSVIDDKWWSTFAKNKYNKYLNYSFSKYLEQLNYTKLFSKRIKKENKVKKKNFNLIEHSLSKDLENQILSMWWFDKISDEELLIINERETVYNIPENQYILWILEYYFNSDRINEDKKALIENIIKKYVKSWVISKITDDIPKKLLQHPIFSLIVKEYLYTKEKILRSEKKIRYEFWSFNNKFLWEDPIKSFTELYEIYCFIKYREFLSKLGIQFVDKIKDNLYDSNEQKIIKYENTFDRWYIKWNYQNQLVKLYFGDKLFFENKRNYWLFSEDQNFEFINKKFKKVSKDWITPDITIEVWWKLIIWDVKFSCFKDINTKLEYPNPFYFMEELQKYRRIFVNQKIIETPIIIFYPGNIEKSNLSKFMHLHELIFKSYNTFLFPINNNDNQWLFDFLKTNFLKILSS